METFQRFEKKYLLNDEQFRKMMVKLKGHIMPDKFIIEQVFLFKSLECLHRAFSFLFMT